MPDVTEGLLSDLSTSSLTELALRTTTAVFVQEVCSALVEPHVHRALVRCRVPRGVVYRVTFAALRFVLVIAALVALTRLGRKKAGAL